MSTVNRLTDYHHKLLILRQIMSNKARRFRRLDTLASVATVVVSSVLTFMGFAGLPTIQEYLSLLAEVELPTIGLIFNLLVLALFILVVLHLVFRFGDKQAVADRAVVSLTHLINEIEDEFAFTGSTPYTEATVKPVRERYRTLIEALPSNSDKEFLRAKKDFREKQLRKSEIDFSAQQLFNPTDHERMLRTLVQQSVELMDILRTLRSVDERLYLGGGLVRNAVWDFLHGYQRPTPIDDVDVIYFDKLSGQKEHDVALERQLRGVTPNIRWSVKNQARMHDFNDEEPYESLNDAVKKWPETATACVVRLDENEQLNLIAPFGLDDLFRLVVRPTPHFELRLDRYQERIVEKAWLDTWPKLIVLSAPTGDD